MSITGSTVESVYIINGQKFESDNESSAKHSQKDERVDTTGEYNYHSPLNVPLTFNDIDKKLKQ